MSTVSNQKIIIVVAAHESVQMYYVPQIDGVFEIEYHLEPYARCVVVDQQAECMKTESRDMTITFYCAHDTDLTYFTTSIDDCNHAQDIRVVLQGHRARARIRGVYVLGDAQQIVIQSKQEHCFGFTTSDVLFKGVLVGNGSMSYNGTIYVAPGAHKSSARQYNMNLLSGGGSATNVRSVPSLEVLADNVTCAHGSAVGQLDALHLFYLQSRGIVHQAAKELLVKGFIADTLKDIAGIDEDDLMARIAQKI
jgi:Fe-S cluster assembly scaffold protein SufB